MKVRFVTFKVKGGGEFPFDMLRKDCCFPRNEKDSYLMAAQGIRTVTLDAHWTDSGKFEPNYDRWESFGWTAEIITNELMR